MAATGRSGAAAVEVAPREVCEGEEIAIAAVDAAAEIASDAAAERAAVGKVIINLIRKCSVKGTVVGTRRDAVRPAIPDPSP